MRQRTNTPVAYRIYTALEGKGEYQSSNHVDLLLD